ncbi:unnamed protein product [Didymodactylos carnosus]|uniref:Uncharacterized protein n=1 Tax=Didymodactylos carnosus TaxID=1234261 RepID=A0A815FQM2_9BILA|nr:unnamed protein product [Didymodactylos carnosus]CAF1326786.1 unnamed protein product [Didymodactylos carnosus]CAF3656350.1 unnamed protein product [Didymodactylos carnosus]CAF4177285.1 unnamed protein product [Didymodactylos carnosus]
MCFQFSVVFLILPCIATGLEVTVSNTQPRVDVDGQLMDIHDGNIVQWIPGGYYYWYGNGYTLCKDTRWGCEGVFALSDCGFRTNHSINLYVSPDLYQWKFVRNILPAEVRPNGIYYRPKVIYNPQTKQYVLWVNIVEKTIFGIPNFLNATYVVATSPTPDGQFTVRNPRVKTLQYGNGGDFALLVDDDDGQGYIAYDAFNDFHALQIERLAPDFLSTLGSIVTSGIITPINNEAPIFFKRYGWYYLLYGQRCCFCRQGSNSHVLVSRSPLGPFIDTGVDSEAHGQESFVIQAMLADNSIQFIFVADRWVSDHDKYMAHDLQFWAPLVSDDSQNPPLPQLD